MIPKLYFHNISGTMVTLNVGLHMPKLTYCKFRDVRVTMGTWYEQVVRMLCVNMQIIGSLYLMINIWFQGMCLGKTYRIIDR